MDDPDANAVISYNAEYLYDVSGSGDEIMTGIEHRLDVRPIYDSLEYIVGKTVQATIITRSSKVRMNAMVHPHNDGVRLSVTTHAGAKSKDVCLISE